MQRKRSYVEAMERGSLDSSNCYQATCEPISDSLKNLNSSVSDFKMSNSAGLNNTLGDASFKSKSLEDELNRSETKVIEEDAKTWNGESDVDFVDYDLKNNASNNFTDTSDENFNEEQLVIVHQSPKNSAALKADEEFASNGFSPSNLQFGERTTVLESHQNDGDQITIVKEEYARRSLSEGDLLGVGPSNGIEDFSRIDIYENIDNFQRTNSQLDDIPEDESSVFPLEYFGRNSTRRKRPSPEHGGLRSKRWKRVVFRNGDTNVPLRQNIDRRAGKFMNDLVTTLIECRWRWLTFLFAICNFALWLAFGLMFYVSSYANGDMDGNPDSKLCITDGRSFTGIFGFSVETQVSIGYGEKSPTEECPEVIFIMVMEVIAGYALIGGMTCIVYAKISRPEKRVEGVGFSKNVAVCMRDGQLCLLARVWDAKEKHSVGGSISLWLVRHLPAGPCVRRLALQQAGALVLGPRVIQHTIDADSPLYDMSAKDLVDKKFEIVITFTGASRLTGQMSQSKTSYLPSDIRWGHRFINVLSFNIKKGEYSVDVGSLDKMLRVDTPLCSARLLSQLASDLSSVSGSLPVSPVFLSPPGSPPLFSPPGSPPSSSTSRSWSYRHHILTNKPVQHLI